MKDWRNSDREFLDSSAVANILGLDKTTVNLYFRSGGLKGRKFNVGARAHWFIKRDDLLDFMGEEESSKEEKMSETDSPSKAPQIKIHPAATEAKKKSPKTTHHPKCEYHVGCCVPLDLLTKIEHKRASLVPMPTRSTFLRELLEEAMN